LLLWCLLVAIGELTSSQLFSSQQRDKIRVQLEMAGRSMLKEMENTEGTVALDGGVILHVLEPNPDGPRPTLASKIQVHYHGTLPDGTVFDSTLTTAPVTFLVSQVIPGWQSALLKMHEGEIAMVGVPPEQAYGTEGTPDGLIPGGATLFFKVHLVQVLTGAIGGAPTLFGADGLKLEKGKKGGSVLLGADGKPMF
jgi:FKBP-type peptidyl-prolyl cis-trans isomerase